MFLFFINFISSMVIRVLCGYLYYLMASICFFYFFSFFFYSGYIFLCVNRYFRHAAGSLMILSKNLAQYININRWFSVFFHAYIGSEEIDNWGSGEGEF